MEVTNSADEHQQTLPKRRGHHHHSPLENLLHDLLHLVLHFDVRVFKPLRALLFTPGRALLHFSHEQKRGQKALTYFLVFLGIHIALAHLLLIRLGFNYQLSAKFDHILGPVMLLCLLGGMGVIGFLTLGWRWFRKKKKNDYSFEEVFVICLYIYGTNYFLAPFIVIGSVYIEDLLNLFGQHYSESDLGKITDIPLAVFMFYMLYMLIKKTPNFQNRNLRFLAFAIISAAYYLFMYRYVYGLTPKH